MARRARLQELLGNRFADSKELRAFVDDTFGTDAVHSIGWEEGVNDETSDLIAWLERKGRMAELWPALRTAFPNVVAEIDAVAAEWKPGPLAKLLPRTLIRSRPFQVGVAAFLFVFATLVWFLWVRSANYTTVLVLDGAARDAIANDKLFTVSVDGVDEPIGVEGVSIGRSELLPSSLVSAYRAEIKEPHFPRKISVRLTKSRAKSIVVSYKAKPCPVQPQVIADDHLLRVVKLDDCDGDSTTAAAEPKPTIGIAVSIVNSDNFKSQFKNALKAASLSPTPTVEEFLTQRLLEQFGKLEMFSFVAATPTTKKERTLVASIETAWPSSGDVVMWLQLGSEIRHPIRIVDAIGCDNQRCSTENLASHHHYDALFREFFGEWPTGFLKSVPLTTTAIYEDGGGVRVVEDLARFGQQKGGPPTALFDIEYGNNRQRTFVLCYGQAGSSVHKSGGFDVPPDQAPLLCSKRTPTDQPGGKNGVVTLLKLLVVR